VGLVVEKRKTSKATRKETGKTRIKQSNRKPETAKRQGTFYVVQQPLERITKRIAKKLGQATLIFK